MAARAVLFDFTGTLFYIEDARSAATTRSALSSHGSRRRSQRWGAINGSGTPDDLPAELAEVWEQRDLSRAAHRAAYSGLARARRLDRRAGHVLYERGVQPAAWHPFPDTLDVLRALREHGVPTALVSNIGWDPRPVLAAYGAEALLNSLVLSDERGAAQAGSGDLPARLRRTRGGTVATR